MSDFFDSDVSVSDDNEDNPNTNIIKDNKAILSEDSEEDEELPNEDEICRKEGQGWIVNDDDVDEGGEGSDDESSASEKLEKDGGIDEEDDDMLDDDDYLLIQENVGINIKRKTKKRRLIVNDEDDADVDFKRAKDFRGREAIARQIFEDEEGYEDDFDRRNEGPARIAPSFAAKSDDEEEESDDMGDFIVDDAAPGQTVKQKRQIVHKDPSLQEAQNIFGVDFDFEEFKQYGDKASDISEESDYEDEEDDSQRNRRGRSESKVAPQDRLYELFDPTDLARNFYSPEDEQIRCTDIPERFQLRSVPIKRIDPNVGSHDDVLNELKKESEWIYNVAFKEGSSKKPPTVTDNIAQVLKLFKESLSEVPFIAFYRKECIKKDLNINDLWRIYDYDEKWEILQQRRKVLIRQLDRMKAFLEAQPGEDTESENKPKPTGLIRLIAMAKQATSLEELHDVRLNYLLNYAGHTEALYIWEGKDLKLDRKKEEEDDTAKRSSEDEDDEEYDPTYGIKKVSLEPNDKLNNSTVVANRKRASFIGTVTTTVDPTTGRRIRQRQVRTTAAYEVAHRAGISGLVEKFGLSVEQFAENVRDQYRRHEVTQCLLTPTVAAEPFLCSQFPDAASALSAARYMLAFQISREPIVRQLARVNLSSQAVINLKSTPKGLKLIDESHPLFPVSFLKNKPATDLIGDVTYLLMHNAMRDGLITFSLNVPECKQRGLSLLEDLEHYFYRDEFSALVKAWNEQRSLLLNETVEKFLQPYIFKEIQDKLLEASQEAVVKLCAQKLFRCIKMAPYVLDDYRCNSGVEKDDPSNRHHNRDHYPDGNGSRSSTVWAKPARVLAFAIKDDVEVTSSMVTAVQLDADGEVVDYLNLPGLLYSANTYRDDLRKQREKDFRRLNNFLSSNSPQAIVVGCNSRRSLALRDEVLRLVEDLAAESRLSSRPNIELMDTELAVVFAQSEAATSILPSTYTPLLKQAISLGRRLQDPLAEFSQLFNLPDGDILGVRWHTSQESVPREMLLKALEIEFINRTNEVGVDVNRCILHPHTANLLQFVAGLGPRKATCIIKLLKQKNVFFTNREILAKVLKLGPHVAINCAGFIKIDTTAVRDLPSSGDNIEILDSMRVHPESYDLARQMAVDALEYDDADDNDPTAALEEIVQSPARLRELDLDAFAEELKRQEHGDKHITLYDIRKELNHRYRDLRDPFEPLTPEQIFGLITHETPDTLHKGSLVECVVLSISTRNPKPDQLDQANPSKNEATGLWRCPFCKQDDFPQLNEIWIHFDSGNCPGQPMGLRVQLENGISGYIPARLIDPPVEKTFENARPGTLLQARVVKIDIAKFSVELTLKSADIKDERHLYKVPRDTFFDYQSEEAERRRQESEEAQVNVTKAYVNRVIFHPHFKNITYSQLVAMEPTLETGAIVIRPSRQGTDHLTVSVKVDDGILKHFDVLEKNKSQSFVLGRTLLVENEEFEDLDEIVARFMQPMVYLIREVLSYKYYQDSQGGKREILADMLRKEKEASRAKIPYFLSASADHPGYFILAYMPNQTPRFEMFSVKHEGFRFRKRMFPSLDRMIGWFKENYNEAASIVGQSHNHPGHHRGSGGASSHRLHQSPAPLHVVENNARTPKMEDFFNLPIPYSGGV